MSLRFLMPLLAACCLSATRLFAHEFWIEPVEFQVESGAPLVADFRNGQNFRGATLAYFEKQSARFDLIQGGKVSPVRPRLGDIPALQTTAGVAGLVVIVHQTMPSTLNYAKWDKFQAFADHKDFPDIRARHLARGLPESGFTESYTRHAKALVAVGHGRGQDVATGMETEFVALANPYTDDSTDGLPVQLHYQGRPRADAQVEVFQRDPAGVVTIRLLRTDARGQVQVPVLSGHAYLLDAVVLREMPTDSPEVWQSLWAALSFAVP